VEVELRACSVYAIARLTDEINLHRAGMPLLFMPKIDFRFWKSYHATHWPHHLTKTGLASRSALMCIFELYCCVRNGCKLLVALMPNERDRFAEQLESDAELDAGTTHSAFNLMLSRVDTRNSTCTLPQDKVRVTNPMKLTERNDQLIFVIRRLLSWIG
jgi:hypothetical protein